MILALWHNKVELLSVDSQMRRFFNLPPSGQCSHIFWRLAVIYLLLVLIVEELSDSHMSNINFFYVFVEKMNHMGLQTKFCFLKSSTFKDKTLKYQVESTKILAKTTGIADRFSWKDVKSSPSPL